MNLRRPLPFVILASIFFLGPIPPASACEPIMVWTVIAGPQYLNFSLGALIAVVGVKCLTFAFIENNIPLIKRPILMLVGNLASSLVGLAVVFPIVVMDDLFLLIGLGALIGLSVGPTKRLRRVSGWKDANPGVVFFSLFLSMVLTMILFGLASRALDENSPVLYWALKLGYIAVAFSISVFVTVLFEEWVIWGLSTQTAEGNHFYPSVLKANLAAFLVAGGIGAAIMLPQRLRSPNFLVDLMEVFRPFLV